MKRYIAKIVQHNLQIFNALKSKENLEKEAAEFQCDQNGKIDGSSIGNPAKYALQISFKKYRTRTYPAGMLYCKDPILEEIFDISIPDDGDKTEIELSMTNTLRWLVLSATSQQLSKLLGLGFRNEEHVKRIRASYKPTFTTGIRLYKAEKLDCRIS